MGCGASRLWSLDRRALIFGHVPHRARGPEQRRALRGALDGFRDALSMASRRSARPDEVRAHPSRALGRSRDARPSHNIRARANSRRNGRIPTNDPLPFLPRSRSALASTSDASFTSEQMFRVLEAAELGIRNRGRALERKVLQAASMGYTKGVAAGKASAAKGASAAEREAEALRRELEDLRSERGGGSTSGYDDAVSTFSDVPPSTRFGPPASGFAKIPEGDSAREWESSADAPSTPDPSVAGAREDSTRADAKECSTRADAKVSALMPRDAGKMPSRVSLGSSGGGAPTAAMWALSVSARDGKIPGASADALDLISTRCQLYFAHEKLARACVARATSRWRLACQEPRRRRLAADDAARRRIKRLLARCFLGWAGKWRPVSTNSARGDESAGRSSTAFPEFIRDSSDPPRPPPPLDRPAAAALVVEVNALKEENARVTAELARMKDELESRGPTPREAAQGEKFRAHLQRLQRELEATKQERDAMRNLAGRASREEEQQAMVRRQKLRSQATQVGGSGELAVGADDVAGMVQFELQSQAAKFHAEFEKQARIAEEATVKLRNETNVRARLEDQHRREVARLREMHASELASLRGEIALRGGTATEAAAAARPRGGAGDRLSDRLSDRQRAERRRDPVPETAPETALETAPAPETTPAPVPAPSSLTAADLAALEAEADQMRHSQRVEEKVRGWEVTGIIAEGILSAGSTPDFSPAKPPLERDDSRDDEDRRARELIRESIRESTRDAPRAPPSLAGSERSTRSRSGTAAAVAAAVRAGGARAVDALLASGEFEPDETAPRPSPFPGAGYARSAPASVTLAAAQLVMRGHGKAEALEALEAVGGNDVNAAHEWLRDRRRNSFFTGAH